MPEPQNDDPKAHPFHGKTIAGCVVGDALGRGRTSWVCRAQHLKLDREVAIKILSGDLAELTEIRERFVAEARAVAQIDHPHIVKVLDVLEDQGHLCILMEYVAGETLQDRLDKGGALPVRKSLRIAHQTAEALAAAHAEGVIHRDVKPANVLLVQGSDEVKVVDFGLAGPKNLANRAGTPLYMSPEACQGKRIDEKSDVYALGVCLYQMLTGLLPFQGKSVRQILAAHVKGEFAPISKVNPPLGSTYDDLMKRLLVTSKGYRPTAAEMVELLAPLIATGGGAADKRKGGRGGRRARPVRASSSGPPAAVIVIGIVAVIAVAFGALLVMRKGDEPPPQPEVPAEKPPIQPIRTEEPPPPPPKDPAEEAFNEVKDWASEHEAPEFEEELARRWQGVADAYSGTTWGDKAADNARRLRGERAPDTGNGGTDEPDPKALRAAANAAARKALDEALARYDFAEASRLAEEIGDVPLEEITEWRGRKERFAFLGERFLETFNTGVKDRHLEATYLKTDAGHDEVIVEADSEGVATRAGDLPRRIPWKQVSAEQIYEFMKRKIVSQSDVDGNVFLAILAAEVGLRKKADQHLEVCGLVDQTGTSPQTIRKYFPGYRPR